MNKIIKLSAPICMFFVSCIVFTCSTGINSSFRIIVEKDKRVAGMVNGIVAAKSVIDCALKCYSSGNCNIANYFAKNKTCCFLKQPCGITEDAIGWIHLRKQPATFLHVTDRPETWDGAKRYCESIGGGLANIIAPSDYDMILSILNPSHETDIWIGGSDRVDEGDWIWSNGCRFNDQDFNFWIPDQPDNFENHEHCLEILYSEWNDDICSTMQTFVCEI